MKIKKISVASFGNIKDKTITFNDGLNVIYGNNESGKTTLFAFIRYMLFSFHGRKTLQSLTQEEKYMPWDNTSAFGNMEFVHNNTDYMVTRSTGIKKEYSVINTATGERSFEGEEPGDRIYNLNESAFLRTYFLSAMSGSFSGDKNDDILKRLSNLSGSCDENFSYDAANTKMVSDIKKLTKDIESKSEEIMDLRKRLESIGNLKEKRDSINLKLDGLNSQVQYENAETDIPDIEIHDKTKEQLEDAKANQLQRILIFSVLFVCTTVLMLANAVSLEVVLAGYGLSILSLVLTLLGAFRISKLKSRLIKESKKPPLQFAENNSDIIQDNGEMTSLLKELGAVESQLDREYSYDDVCSHIDSLTSEKAELEERLSVIHRAKNILDVSYEQMKNVFAPALNSRSSEIFASLTGNKYSEMIVTDNFSIKIKEAYDYKSSLFYSRAMLELMYISLRLALCDILESEEKHTVFLDDCFAYLDDDRAKDALLFLADYAKSGRQIVFSTCHTRELNILSQIDGVNIIKM